jgi:hypothetical protein
MATGVANRGGKTCEHEPGRSDLQEPSISRSVELTAKLQFNKYFMDNISVSCLVSRYKTGNKSMQHNNQIDSATLGRALMFRNISDGDLTMAVSAMSESWKTDIAVRLGKLAADLQDLAMVAAEVERRFLDATTACSRA